MAKEKLKWQSYPQPDKYVLRVGGWKVEIRRHYGSGGKPNWIMLFDNKPFRVDGKFGSSYLPHKTFSTLAEAKKVAIPAVKKYLKGILEELEQHE